MGPKESEPPMKDEDIIMVDAGPMLYSSSAKEVLL